MTQKKDCNDMLPIDLHVHSTRSDGTFTPAGLVDYAMEKGLAAFALTDHDTVDGLEEAIQYAESLRSRRFLGCPDHMADPMSGKTSPTGPVADTDIKETSIRRPHPCSRLAPASGADAKEASPATAFGSDGSSLPAVPEVIPGIEFSTEYHGKDIHIIGLYINHKSPLLHTRLRAFVDSRVKRNQKMCGLLQKAGIDVTYQALLESFPDAVITRAHYAKYMLTCGYVKTMREAFDRYVGDGCPCYVPREKVTPVQAVQLILEIGGIPILAHPTLYHLTEEQLEQLTAELKAAGLKGVEAVYSTYTDAEERSIRRLASRHGLLVSGGSDFHGANKPGLDLATGYGKLFLPYSVLAEIKKAAGR